MKTCRTNRLLSIVGLLACIIAFQFFGATALAKGEGNKPSPDAENVKYGPDALNVLDVWKPKSDHPTPLLIFIHGGGFSAGSKGTLPPKLLDACLKSGIAVASIDYRLSPAVSFPAHFMDGARVIQFLRYKAKDYNIDPNRVALSGSSAGAGTSLWIGFHDDMADPKNEDPILRESTRVACVAVLQAQTTYDPRTIKEIVGESAARHPALPGFYGLKPDEFDTAKAHEMYEKASPVNYLTADDPPVYAHYAGFRKPLAPGGKPGDGIHHVNFGIFLKERMDKLKIECIIRSREDGTDPIPEMTAFLVKHLHPTGQSNLPLVPSPGTPGEG